MYFQVLELENVRYEAVFISKYRRQGRHWLCETRLGGGNWYKYDAISQAKLVKLENHSKLSKKTKMIVYGENLFSLLQWILICILLFANKWEEVQLSPVIITYYSPPMCHDQLAMIHTEKVLVEVGMHCFCSGSGDHVEFVR